MDKIQKIILQEKLKTDIDYKMKNKLARFLMPDGSFSRFDEEMFQYLIDQIRGDKVYVGIRRAIELYNFMGGKERCFKARITKN